jgi:hypothetical protein
MKIGIIAGNRFLPVLLAKTIKEKNKDAQITAVCFKGETSRQISRYCDQVFWVDSGHLSDLRKVIKENSLKDMVMAGQISPWRIFKPQNWDKELTGLIRSIPDFRPHTIFSKIIEVLEKDGARFLDSTAYLKDFLPLSGLMNNVSPSPDVLSDVDFGVRIISRFVEMDVGQTVVVNQKTVVALEAVEGTDNAIIRGCRVSAKGAVILKFAKANQDLRFDVPVVGLATMSLLKKFKARAIVLEEGKVIILDKQKFLQSADRAGISVIGRRK